MLVFASTLNHLVLFLLLTTVMALFSSLSHEIIHGHPTGQQKINDFFAVFPIALYPYYEYKRSHLKHHIDADLTRPGIDPESFFVTAQQWSQLSPFCRGLRWLNMTLLGRLFIGPAHTIYGLLCTMLQQLKTGSSRIKLQWLIYIAGAAAVLLMASKANIPLWLYLLSAYFSLSVIAVRSFYEHKPNQDPTKRTVVVESCTPFRLLYLYNNFHAVHHKYPTMAWYQIAQEFKRNRQPYLIGNEQFYFSGYRRWLKFLLKPVAHPVHPFEQ